jgi:hypothetical protein
MMIYYISITEIKKNWGKYRCNPMFMMFSDNLEDDFKHCITSTQNASIGPLLQPVTTDLTTLQTTSKAQQEQIDKTTDQAVDMKGYMDKQYKDMTGKFQNTSVGMQKISFGIKDLLSKISGIAISLMYILDGNAKTMKSVWKGPPGQVMRKLSTLGHCFHPDTKLKLLNGETVSMQNIKLGSVLENGSKVVSVMKVDNSHNEHLMKIVGDDGNNIYVTGSHLIKEGTKFIEVCDSEYATEQTEIATEWFSCLITDDHLIKIGGHTFWDWEDYKCYYFV